MVQGLRRVCDDLGVEFKFEAPVEEVRVSRLACVILGRELVGRALLGKVSGCSNKEGQGTSAVRI